MIICAASVLTSLRPVIVDHGVLAQKLAGLRLPEQIYMWILSFLSDRSSGVAS